MKKQTNLSRSHAGKLSLNKRTISNLRPSEMEKRNGGSGWTCTWGCPGNRTQVDCGGTRNGNTCPGHNTCYTCWYFSNDKIKKMKKQSNLSRLHAGKLSLSKRTISNLNSSEMNRVIGASGWWCSQGNTCHCSKNCTQNQNTCPGHNTCYTCWVFSLVQLSKNNGMEIRYAVYAYDWEAVLSS